MGLEILGTIVWLALIDSLDPCIFAIYSVLLLSASMISIKRVFTVGSSFIASAYIGYLIFGLFLRYITLSLPKYIFAAVTMVYGTIMLFHTLVSRRGTEAVDNSVCRENEIACRVGRALRIDVFAEKGVLAILLIGFIAAFTLFPCTAGMYIVFNLLTAEFRFVEWLPLALLYVAVFISPLFLLLLSFVGITKLRVIRTALLSHQDYIKILGSILLIAVSLYILSTSRIL